MGTSVATRVALVALLVCAIPSPLLAQRNYSRLEVQRGAELSLFGGGTVTATGAAAAFGWSAGWRVTPRVALEGSGTWIEQPGIDGFAALFGTRVYLKTTGDMTPFVTIEGGLFHATVDSSQSELPDLYGLRTIPGSPEKKFNDFVAAGGAGLDLHIGGRIWLRPDARLLVVVDGWRANVVMLAGAHFTFRFGGAASSP